MKPKGNATATATRTTNLLIVRPNYGISDESLEKVRLEAEAAEAAQEKAIAEAEAEAKAAQEKAIAEAAEKTKRLSIDQISDKAEKLHLLRGRYEEIKNKKRQVENFAISHDRNNARLTLVDAEGYEITTSNPVSIKKVLEDWKTDLNRHLEETEKDMRTELAMYA
jgi:hypothetical protein